MVSEKEGVRNIVKIIKPENLGYKIFDFHCHLNQNLGQNLHKYGIQSACIMPSWKNLQSVNFSKEIPNNFTHSEDYVKELDECIMNPNNSELNGWNGNLYRFIPVDFTQSVEHFCRLLDSNKFAGVKLHPLQNFKINRETLDPFILEVQERNLILYIHTDWLPSTEWKQVKDRTPETFEKIVKMYPKVPIIMGHSGFNDSFVNVWKLVKKYKNIYAESSFAATPQELEKIIYKADRTRVIFGSSFPLSATAGEIMKIHKMRRVTQDDKIRVFWDNSAELLKGYPYVTVKDGKLQGGNTQ